MLLFASQKLELTLVSDDFLIKNVNMAFDKEGTSSTLLPVVSDFRKY